MLKTLLVKNYALIADIVVDLHQGLNIFTGETGAGKSILLGALGTVLGDRMDTSVLREGTKKTTVEAVFSVKQGQPLYNFLESEDLAADDQDVILRRELYDTGRTRAYINDTPVQLAILQTVGDFLVDFHGQHAHQSLLREKNHLGFVDEFGGFKVELSEVKVRYKDLKGLFDSREKLEEKRRGISLLQEQYRVQIVEIDKINPENDEDAVLEKEAELIRQGERLFDLSNQCYNVLYEIESSAFDQVTQACNSLSELRSIDGDFEGALNDLNSTRLTIEDLAKLLASYRDRIDFSAERLEQTQARLAALSGLKKKYGPTLQEVINTRRELGMKFENLEELDNDIETLSSAISKSTQLFSEACQRLSAKRKGAAREIETKLAEVLEYLGMPGSCFKVVFKYQDDPNGLARVDGKSYRASASGMDVAKFFVSTNPGAELRPLAKTASGGEISRVMLALKSALISKGQVPVLVFDEIDSGVSGRIASAVGRKVQELSQVHQVLCITHLPQIASMADTHYVVEKKQSGQQTSTGVRKLAEEEQTEAIAKLIAGEKVSEAHLKSAGELLQDAIT